MGTGGDADVVILAVAAPYRDGMTRLDMYEKACSIMDSIIPPVMESGFEGIFLVITNPVDLITQYVQKLSGLPDRKVIGTGTLPGFRPFENVSGRPYGRGSQKCGRPVHGRARRLPDDPMEPGDSGRKILSPYFKG